VIHPVEPVMRAAIVVDTLGLSKKEVLMSTDQKESAGMALSNAVADAVERAGAVTVMVMARRRLPSSGVVFQNGLILTADHAIERDDNLLVGLPDGSQVTAELAGRDRGSDLAVLRFAGGSNSLENARTTVNDAGAPGGPRVGHLVIAAGRPSSEGVQASLGMITGIGGALRTGRGTVIDRYLVTDAAPLPGFSGGPLVDLDGRLVGINTSGLVRGASLAIAARLALEIGSNLAQHGSVRRGYLGIRSQQVELPAQAVEALNGQKTGLLIMGIEADGPAAKGEGLLVGDILVEMGAAPVANHDDLLVALASQPVGEKADVRVVRGGQVLPVSVLVGERI
jgi:S1-C subfamily serine protease